MTQLSSGREIEPAETSIDELPFLPDPRNGGDPGKLPDDEELLDIRQSVTWLAFGELWTEEQHAKFWGTAYQVACRREHLMQLSGDDASLAIPSALTDWCERCGAIADSIDRAKAEILMRIRSGDLPVIGCKENDEKMYDVPAKQFKILPLQIDIFFDRPFIPRDNGKEGPKRTAGTFSGQFKEWYLHTSDLVKLGRTSAPQESEVEPEGQVSSGRGVVNAREWLFRHVGDHKAEHGGRWAGRKADVMNRLTQQFGLSVRQANAVWGRVAERHPELSAPGPKSQTVEKS